MVESVGYTDPAHRQNVAGEYQDAQSAMQSGVGAVVKGAVTETTLEVGGMLAEIVIEETAVVLAAELMVEVVKPDTSSPKKDMSIVARTPSMALEASSSTESVIGSAWISEL